MIERFIVAEFARVAHRIAHADIWLARIQQHIIDRELDKRVG